MIATSLASVVRALAAALLCSCHVYEDMCVAPPRDNPGGGVTVRVSELADDAGTDEGVEVEARKL